MNPFSVNFSWLEHDPLRLALTTWLFVLVGTAPMAVAGLVYADGWLTVSPLLFATGMGLGYFIVSARMQSLMARQEIREAEGPADEEFRADCCVVKNLLSMPGIVLARGDRLMLTPLFGAAVDLSLSQIQSVSERRWFKGELMIARWRGYWLAVPSFWRLGVALQEASAFRAVLERNAVQFKSCA